MRSREQRLVDITFQCVSMVLDDKHRAHFAAMTQEERMAWVAKQLELCGFPTTPIGMSWGVLKDP